MKTPQDKEDKEDKEAKEDSSAEEMDVDEIELTLRRFAMTHNDQPLTKLLNSMFTQPIKESEGED